MIKRLIHEIDPEISGIEAIISPVKEKPDYTGTTRSHIGRLPMDHVNAVFAHKGGAREIDPENRSKPDILQSNLRENAGFEVGEYASVPQEFRIVVVGVANTDITDVAKAYQRLNLHAEAFSNHMAGDLKAEIAASFFGDESAAKDVASKLATTLRRDVMIVVGGKEMVVHPNKASLCTVCQKQLVRAKLGSQLVQACPEFLNGDLGHTNREAGGQVQRKTSNKEELKALLIDGGITEENILNLNREDAGTLSVTVDQSAISAAMGILDDANIKYTFSDEPEDGVEVGTGTFFDVELGGSITSRKAAIIVKRGEFVDPFGPGLSDEDFVLVEVVMGQLEGFGDIIGSNDFFVRIDQVDLDTGTIIVNARMKTLGASGIEIVSQEDEDALVQAFQSAGYTINRQERRNNGDSVQFELGIPQELLTSTARTKTAGGDDMAIWGPDTVLMTFEKDYAGPGQDIRLTVRVVDESDEEKDAIAALGFDMDTRPGIGFKAFTSAEVDQALADAEKAAQALGVSETFRDTHIIEIIQSGDLSTLSVRKHVIQSRARVKVAAVDYDVESAAKDDEVEYHINMRGEYLPSGNPPTDINEILTPELMARIDHSEIREDPYTDDFWDAWSWWEHTSEAGRIEALEQLDGTPLTFMAQGADYLATLDWWALESLIMRLGRDQNISWSDLINDYVKTVAQAPEPKIGTYVEMYVRLRGTLAMAAFLTGLDMTAGWRWADVRDSFGWISDWYSGDRDYYYDCCGCGMDDIFYAKLAGYLAPIRWAAPVAVKQGVFTAGDDVEYLGFAWMSGVPNDTRGRVVNSDFGIYTDSDKTLLAVEWDGIGIVGVLAKEVSKLSKTGGKQDCPFRHNRRADGLPDLEVGDQISFRADQSGFDQDTLDDVTIPQGTVVTVEELLGLNVFFELDGRTVVVDMDNVAFDKVSRKGARVDPEADSRLSGGNKDTLDSDIRKDALMTKRTSIADDLIEHLENSGIMITDEFNIAEELKVLMSVDTDFNSVITVPANVAKEIVVVLEILGITVQSFDEGDPLMDIRMTLPKGWPKMARYIVRQAGGNTTPEDVREVAQRVANYWTSKTGGSAEVQDTSSGYHVALSFESEIPADEAGDQSGAFGIVVSTGGATEPADMDKPIFLSTFAPNVQSATAWFDMSSGEDLPAEITSVMDQFTEEQEKDYFETFARVTNPVRSRFLNHRAFRFAILKGAPASSVLDEGIWDDAKEAVGPDDGSYDDYWAVVMTVYKNMGGKLKEGRKTAATWEFVVDYFHNGSYVGNVKNKSEPEVSDLFFDLDAMIAAGMDKDEWSAVLDFGESKGYQVLDDGVTAHFDTEQEALTAAREIANQFGFTETPNGQIVPARYINRKQAQLLEAEDNAANPLSVGDVIEIMPGQGTTNVTPEGSQWQIIEQGSRDGLVIALPVDSNDPEAWQEIDAGLTVKVSSVKQAVLLQDVEKGKLVKFLTNPPIEGEEVYQVSNIDAAGVNMLLFSENGAPTSAPLDSDVEIVADFFSANKKTADMVNVGDQVKVKVSEVPDGIDPADFSRAADPDSEVSKAEISELDGKTGEVVDLEAAYDPFPILVSYGNDYNDWWWVNPGFLERA